MLSCEVKGFESLEESLASVVQEETLEGDSRVEDNHGAKVDAVRQYSIDQLPDTLIVHLMRFEFVLATMSRKKVNDKMSFPMSLNMHKFTTAGIAGAGHKGRGGSAEECEYQLRGVVLHSGAIDRGHYYSFIQERESPYHWYAFNDSHVSPFDPESIPDECFGGVLEPEGVSPVPNGTGKAKSKPQNSSSVGTSTGSSALPQMKIQNAYMLFYDRVQCAESRLSVAKLGPPLGLNNLLWH